MAGVMAQCGGLECMLNRLSGIKDFKQGRHLLTVRFLLLDYFYLFIFFLIGIYMFLHFFFPKVLVQWPRAFFFCFFFFLIKLVESEIRVLCFSPTGFTEVVQLLCEGENQQAAAGQT